MTKSPSPHDEPGGPHTAQTASLAYPANSPSPRPGSGSASSRRYNLQLRECIETKTITTTTRLTRQYPNVLSHDPKPLDSLDAKEYPLARRPPPPELANFRYTFSADGQRGNGLSEDYRALEQDDHQSAFQSPNNRLAAITSSREVNASELSTRSDPIRNASRSPSENISARTRRSKSSRPASPASAVNSPTPSQRPSRSSHATRASSDAMRRAVAHAGGSGLSSGSIFGGRRETQDRTARVTSGYLATPDTSEMAGMPSDRLSRRRNSLLDRTGDSLDTTSTASLRLSCDAASPAPSDAQTIFGSNVATPPITDTDAAPFGDSDDALQSSLRALHNRPSVDIAAAQDASLPSPRLSPTLAAAQLHTANSAEPGESSSFPSAGAQRSLWAYESQETEDADSFSSIIDAARADNDAKALVRRGRSEPSSVVVEPQMLLDAFDSMHPHMKNFMMYEFLRRCSRPTLRIIADAVNPALKCDFLHQLPLEISYQVLSYLDFRDLCRAAQVSKRWRAIIDQNETGWKELFDRDGYKLPLGELDKAIVQGWGWQDPAGLTDYEKDLSMHNRLTLPQQELNKASKGDTPAPRSRTSKRKRGLNTHTSSSSTKRRACTPVSGNANDNVLVKQHKSEGPISAASAAAAAVPDPQIGLASLRQLHLYKSLYRRHHMIRYGWTSGEVKPAHVAFAAHPRHVITCLQFDEDKIITGSDDTLIHVYDTKTGKLLKKLEGHEGGVWALQYEGNILVSGSTDRSVRVWDIERGLCQQVFYGHTSTVRCLQILMPEEIGKDADGTPIVRPEKPLIITGSRDSQLRVWRLPEAGSRRYIQTGPPANESDCPYFIRVMAGHTHSVRAISAHGDTLVSGSYDSSVRVWRISTGESLHVLHGHSQKVYSVVLDHKRNRCISGSMDSLVKIWDLNTGSLLYTLEGHSLLVGLLDLNEERLVSAAADSTLRIWDPETGRCRNTLTAHTGAITCFQHDGQKVISGSEKTVKMWDITTGQCVQDLLTDLTGVWQVKFDDRRCVAAVQRDQLTYVEILDFGALRDGRPPEELGRRILLNEPEVQAILEEET